MVKAKQGRARFVTADRATIRTLRDEDIAAIDTPGKLVRLFQKLGYETRITGKSHHMIYGPGGKTMTVPQTWSGPRGRDNCLADARRVGLLPGKNEEWTPVDGSLQIELGVDIPKTYTQGGRTTLTYVKEEDQMTQRQPDSYALQSELANRASKSELLALVDIVSELSARVDGLKTVVDENFESHVGALNTFAGRITALEDQLSGGKVVRPRQKLRRDRLAEIRDEIVAFLSQFPGEPKFPLGFITANLSSDDLPPTSYANQLKKLVEEGKVVQHKVEGDRSGAKTMYSLAVKVES